jgi:hypothetical protein
MTEEAPVIISGIPRVRAGLIALATLFCIQDSKATDLISPGNLQVFSQVVDGDIWHWKTTITLLNLGTGPANFTLNFYGDDGLPLTLSTNLGQASIFSGAIAPGGSLVIETPGTAPTLLQGWGLLKPDPGAVISGSAVFRERVAGLPDLEASVPGDGGSTHRVALPFDHIAAASGVALVNPGSFSSISVSVVFRDESGALILQDSFQMLPLTHQAITMTQKYPQTIGHRGTMEISTTGFFPINVLGLRFVPDSRFIALSFTSITPVASSSW